ncbi:MAG TPA: hypothetical protein PK360_02875, partial [bacterium]|nr:hypothetical protein [bacterium]
MARSLRIKKSKILHPILPISLPANLPKLWQAFFLFIRQVRPFFRKRGWTSIKPILERHPKSPLPLEEGQGEGKPFLGVDLLSSFLNMGREGYFGVHPASAYFVIKPVRPIFN